jgi:hypothetical protein
MRLTTKSASNTEPLSVTTRLVFPLSFSGSSGHSVTRSPRTTLTSSRCRPFMTVRQCRRVAFGYTTHFRRASPAGIWA